MGKKYEVGEQIKTVDELMSVTSAFITTLGENYRGESYRMTHRGIYGHWKLKTAHGLVKSGRLYHRKEVKK